MEIRGNVFCFVGKFAIETKPLRQRLHQAGARVTSFDDPEATVVVLGSKAKSKARAARKRGLTIVTMQELEAALSAPIPQPPESQPGGPTSPYELMIALHSVDPSNGEVIGELLSQAQANGVVVDLDPDRESAAGDEPAWLLAWCSDADGCELYVIPENGLDAGRRADLLAVAGLCFANSADATPKQLGAAIRLIAARTHIGERDADELASELFAAWRDELEGAYDRAGVRGADDLRGHMGWLLEVCPGAGAQLGRGFTKVIAVNRAM